MENKRFGISSFVLKVVALFTMTLDHVGFMMEDYSLNPELANIFRIIGRLALPLFCFMIVEGVMHTKSFKKYILRLSIMALVIAIAQVFMEFVMHFSIYQGGIFIDLLLGAIAVKCLMDKRLYIKALALLPLLFGVLSFIWYGFDYVRPNLSWYFPYFLRTQYSFYSIILMIGFYFSYSIMDFIFSLQGFSKGELKGSQMERSVLNGINAGILIICTTIYYLTGLLLSSNGFHYFVTWDYSMQNYAMVSCALLLLYNGKRGYNSKWFQYGSYLYYAIHLLLIAGIFFIIF